MDDREACDLISLSIGNILRQSLNDTFREECKRQLGAENTNMVEEILSKSLLTAIQKRPALPNGRTTTNVSPAQQNANSHEVGLPMESSEEKDRIEEKNATPDVSLNIAPTQFQELCNSSAPLFDSDDESQLTWKEFAFDS